MNRGRASLGKAPKQAQVNLRLLGEPHFTIDAADVTPRSKRARALVAYLALARGHAAPRPRLADLFWGDRGEAQARGSLRQCLLEVRDAIGEPGAGFLVADRESVMLGGDWTSDLAAIDLLLHAANAAAIADGIERAGREAILGSLFVSDEFDAWLLLARADFDRKLAEAARRGLEIAAETGDDESARRIADEYLLRDPGDEEIVVLAMQADARRGASPVAHRRFQRLRDHLANELGTAPGKASYDALAALSRSAGAAPTARSAAHETVGGAPVLIVGPFEQLGFSDDAGHLASGIREEVASGLSRFRELRVLVDDMVPSTGDQSLFPDAGAAYVLTVTLRQAPQGIRVTPVLRRLSDNSVAWSQQNAFEKLGLEQAVDVIVDRIIGAVAPRIERDVMPSGHPTALYDRYLGAKQIAFYPKIDHATARNHAAALEEIIAAAPDMVVAYGPLIRLYNTHYVYTVAGEDPAALRGRAFALAQTALSIDRGHIHNYIVMGWCHLWRGNWDAARTHLEQAIRLNPFHAERLKEAAYGMLFLGHHDEGDAYLQRCLELDPLPNDNFFEDLGFLRLLQQRPEEASSYLDLIAEPTLFAGLFQIVAATATGRSGAASAARAWRDSVEAIWTASRPFTEDNLVAWLKQFLPFRREDHWRIFEAYLRPALR